MIAHKWDLFFFHVVEVTSIQGFLALEHMELKFPCYEKKQVGNVYRYPPFQLTETSQVDKCLDYSLNTENLVMLLCAGSIIHTFNLRDTFSHFHSCNEYIFITEKTAFSEGN